MKPAKPDVRVTLNVAANDLRTIEALAYDALVNDALENMAAITALAQRAHDLLDALARALGDPGFGYISPAFRERTK